MSYYQGGRVVSFRLPNNTPETILTYLNEEREKYGRGFSSELADILFEGIYERINKKSNNVLIPLPDGISEEHKKWINETTSRQMIGQWLVQILTNPKQQAPVLNTEQTNEKNNDSHNTPFQTSNYHQKLAHANFFDDED